MTKGNLNDLIRTEANKEVESQTSPSPKRPKETNATLQAKINDLTTELEKTEKKSANSPRKGYFSGKRSPRTSGTLCQFTAATTTDRAVRICPLGKNHFGGTIIESIKSIPDGTNREKTVD
ncbi:hypothetical protein BH695_5362 [Microcystis aeruginosa PCC 7806SL]|uniref:Uncharacterized protein n=1 Tax=Microcystis aeruginosa PCC 7806SL TaxID=1903187 RepID=A0AB33C4K6_MICA7|nr:hypothetical protein [Microcystis aeruginosa]ARI84641.1 hypothetical protein BH695_5362 [Microcystis aeruginosa PCC 7806SL]